MQQTQQELQDTIEKQLRYQARKAEKRDYEKVVGTGTKALNKAIKKAAASVAKVSAQQTELNDSMAKATEGIKRYGKKLETTRRSMGDVRR